MITVETVLKSGYPYNQTDYWNVNDVIRENKKKIFIYDYPIADAFKDDFESHFCRHFYKRELAYQNIGEFCYELNDRLCNIFPWYNNYLLKIGSFDDLNHNGAGSENYWKENKGTHITDNEHHTTDNMQNVTDYHNTDKDTLHDNTKTLEDVTGHSTDIFDGNVNTTENINVDTTGNVKNKDFPISVINGSEDQYETDSSRSVTNQTTDRNTDTRTDNTDNTDTTQNTDRDVNEWKTDDQIHEGLSHANQTDKGQFNGRENGSYEDTEHFNKTFTDDTNLNLFEQLKLYRDEIDHVYGYIYRHLDDLFIGIL